MNGVGWLVGFVFGVVCWKKNGKYILWYRVVGDDGYDFILNVGLVCFWFGLYWFGLVWFGLEWLVVFVY